MTVTAISGAPLIILPIGYMGLPQIPQFFSATLIDAANEACIMVGHILTSDGSSHTIDTTGSSSLGWCAGTVSGSWNAASVLKVGLAAVDTGAGPPARAAAVANVITFDVSKSYITSAAPTSGAWNQSVPDAGTKTIANGDLVAFAVQMVTQGATDSCNVNNIDAFGGTFQLPDVTDYTGAAYAAKNRPPNAVITFSDGAFGYFFGGQVASSMTSQSFNNTGTREYGNFIQLPFPTKVYGIAASATLNGDGDFVLYTDPLGVGAGITQQKSVSIDLNTIGAANPASGSTGCPMFLFSSPYSAAANVQLGVSHKPTSATSNSMVYKTVNTSSHLNSDPLGSGCYAINRGTGNFSSQNSGKDRFPIALIVGAFDDATGGAGGGLLTHSGMVGGIRG